MSSFKTLSAGSRRGKDGSDPLSIVKTDSKYSFNKFAFSSSVHKILPFLDFKGAIPDLLDNLLLIKFIESTYVI